MIATDRLADVFVEIADSLVADFDLLEFLSSLTDHAASVCGAAAVGLVLADEAGKLQFMAASNDAGKALELFQIQAEEGPCRDCYLTGSPVVNTDLGDAIDNWPVFAPRAAAAGFRSVHAFPMRLRKNTIGALNLFGGVDVHFAPDEVRVVQALADVATIALLQERRIARSELVAEQLQGALNTRIVVEQAKGAIAQREGVDPAAAFQLLRAQARSTNRKVADIAADILGPRSLRVLVVQTQGAGGAAAWAVTPSGRTRTASEF